MEPILNSDFRDMLCLLNEEKVEYLLVGGWAVSFHAHFRVTEDIDLWIRPTPENAQRVIRALMKFGAPMDGMDIEDFAKPRYGLHIGVPPARIDLLTTLEGVSFEQAWASRLTDELSGIPIQVIGREELLKNKAVVGRAKDLADIESIEGAKRRREAD
ncbi:MAG: hypothetical protein ACE37H_07315 [Phycisphaeraceae bacterium]